MSKLTKNQKLALGKIEAGKAYTLKEASALVKEITTSKFDASVDVDVRLGVDPRKANQMVRGVVSLLTELVSRLGFSHYVRRTRKLKQLLLELTMLAWMSISIRLKVVGLILTLSSLCLQSWVRSVL